MNSRIVGWALVAVAAAALVVIGIVLLTGNGTVAQLSPSASQAQTQQNAAPAASATAGELDTSFGGDGKVVTSLTRGDDTASALAIQADGKIVIAGGGVARYSSDGTLDTSFSGDGKVMTGIYAMTGFVSRAVAIQTDGKIVLVGVTGSFNKSSFALARYDGDGTLDASFGGDGKVRTAFSARGWGADASGVAIQADGKIVVVGWAGGSSGDRFALARYTSDGMLDSSFGGDGKVRTAFSARELAGASGVAIQADGKIVVVGVAGGSSDSRFALARYTSDGKLDATFGRDGKVETDFTARDDEGSGVAIQADGKIVAAGRAGAGVNSHSRFALARYDSDGSLDATFGGDGKVMTAFGLKGDAAAGGRIFAGAAASGVAIQADGKIVAAGSSRSQGRFALARWRGTFALARYDSDGTLDASFGVNGKVETDFTASSDAADGVAIQADGRIVAAGIANEGPRSKVKVALARYLTR